MEPTVNGAKEVKHRLKHIGKQSLLSFVGVLRDEKGEAALLLVIEDACRAELQAFFELVKVSAIVV